MSSAVDSDSVKDLDAAVGEIVEERLTGLEPGVGLGVAAAAGDGVAKNLSQPERPLEVV